MKNKSYSKTKEGNTSYKKLRQELFALLLRKNKIYKNYKFYDEREWRIVPDNNILGSSFIFYII